MLIIIMHIDFFVHKSSIENIILVIIIDSKMQFFYDVFSFKKVQENHSFKRMIKASSSNHHRSKNGEGGPRKSKDEKITRIFCLNF